MRGISLWQPYASGMALQLKGNETRHWSTNFRGELAIHAAKRPMRGEFDFLRYHFTDEQWEGMPFGAILCVVNLVTVTPTDQLLQSGSLPRHLFEEGMAAKMERELGLSKTEMEFGNYEPGRFAWQTEFIHFFKEPIPFKGSQGFFEVPDELVRYERRIA